MSSITKTINEVDLQINNLKLTSKVNTHTKQISYLDEVKLEKSEFNSLVDNLDQHNNYIIVETKAELEAIDTTNIVSGLLVNVIEEDVIYKWNGSSWVNGFPTSGNFVSEPANSEVTIEEEGEGSYFGIIPLTDKVVGSVNIISYLKLTNNSETILEPLYITNESNKVLFGALTDKHLGKSVLVEYYRVTGNLVTSVIPTNQITAIQYDGEFYTDILDDVVIGTVSISSIPLLSMNYPPIYTTNIGNRVVFPGLEDSKWVGKNVIVSYTKQV